MCPVKSGNPDVEARRLAPGHRIHRELSEWFGPLPLGSYVHVVSDQPIQTLGLLGNDATGPYSVTASLAIGSHTLTAVASDNLGVTATSAPVRVTMATYLPLITNGDFSIFYRWLVCPAFNSCALEYVCGMER